MSEVKQQRRVAAHRARNVAYDHNVGRPFPLAGMDQRNAAPSCSERRTQGGPHVDLSASGVSSEAPGGNQGQVRSQCRHRRLRLRNLLLAHLLEVFRAQHFTRRPGEDRIPVGLPWRGRRHHHWWTSRRERVGESSSELRVRPHARFLVGAHRPSRREEQTRRVPEGPERPVENVPIRDPVHEHRVQSPVEVAPPPDADRSHRFRGRHQMPRADREPAGSQQAAEVHEVLEQLALAGSPRLHMSAHRALRAAAPRAPRRRRSRRECAPPRRGAPWRCRPGT